MSTNERARSYADAFYQSAWERWLTTLEKVVAKMEQDPSLRSRLQATGVDFAQRQRLMDGILPADVDLPVRNLLYLLIQHADLESLPDVIATLRQRLRRTSTGPTQVDVVSAVPLSDEQRRTLMESLQQEYKAELDVHYRVDPAILGGLIVRIGDKLIDNSLVKRLEAMKRTLGVAAER